MYIYAQALGAVEPTTSSL